jgi:hypothetical protein
LKVDWTINGSTILTLAATIIAAGWKYYRATLKRIERRLDSQDNQLGAQSSQLKAHDKRITRIEQDLGIPTPGSATM